MCFWYYYLNWQVNNKPNICHWLIFDSYHQDIKIPLSHPPLTQVSRTSQSLFSFLYVGSARVVEMFSEFDSVLSISMHVVKLHCTSTKVTKAENSPCGG